jgi:hypothetical protein
VTATVVPFVAPGLSRLARQMVAEIGEEDQERAEHAFLVAMQTEPKRLPLWQYIAGVDWRAAARLLRRRPAWHPGPVASAVLTAVTWAATVAFGFFDYAVGVCLVFSVFGPVPAVVVAWFTAGVAVCLLAQHVVHVVRGGGRHGR